LRIAPGSLWAGDVVVLGVLLLFLANHWLDGDFMA